MAVDMDNMYISKYKKIKIISCLKIKKLFLYEKSQLRYSEVLFFNDIRSFSNLFKQSYHY